MKKYIKCFKSLSSFWAEKTSGYPLHYSKIRLEKKKKLEKLKIRRLGLELVPPGY